MRTLAVVGLVALLAGCFGRSRGDDDDSGQSGDCEAMADEAAPVVGCWPEDGYTVEDIVWRCIDACNHLNVRSCDTTSGTQLVGDCAEQAPECALLRTYCRSECPCCDDGTCLE